MMEITAENKEEIVIDKEEQVEKDDNIKNKEMEKEVTEDIANIEPTATSDESVFNVIFFYAKSDFKITNKIA